MLSLPPITLRLRGWKLIDRVALAFLLLCSVALGAAAGLLFVYASDLPEIRALEDFRPNVVTELYADDGQLSATSPCSAASCSPTNRFPQVLNRRHHLHRGPAFRRALGRGFPARGRRRLAQHPARTAVAEGASTLTMQLAGNLFLDRSDRSFAPQNPGNAAGHSDRAPLHQAADFHDVRQPDLSFPRQLRI